MPAVLLGDTQLVGHGGTTATELVYRHQIGPVIQTRAAVIDRLFGHGGSGVQSLSWSFTGPLRVVWQTGTSL
jgi:hypothetical protein